MCGCDCCCNKCDSYQDGTATLTSISFIPYQARTANCPIPVSGGDICTNTGENIFTLTSGGFLDATKYVLWVEYDSNCKDFAYSPAIQSCTADNTCLAFRSLSEEDCEDIWTFRIALNTDASNCSPNFPIPVNEEGQLAIRVYYREPCIIVSDNCEAPSPCSNPTSVYRPRYMGGGLITFLENTTNYNIPSVILDHKESECGINGDCN